MEAIRYYTLPKGDLEEIYPDLSVDKLTAGCSVLSYPGDKS